MTKHRKTAFQIALFFLASLSFVPERARAETAAPAKSIDQIYRESEESYRPFDQNWLRIGREAYDRGDYEEALRHIAPAAIRGDAEAQWMMSRLYTLGQGVEENLCLAVVWRDKAARKGHLAAQVGMASAYWIGWGVRRHIGMAYRWAAHAAQRGDKDAEELKAKALNLMDIFPQEARDAWIAEQKDWRPQQQPPIEFFPLPEKYLDTLPIQLSLNIGLADCTE